MITDRSMVMDRFPAEFEHHFWMDLDRRFYGILLASWVVIFSGIATLGNLRYDAAELHYRIREAYLEQLRGLSGRLIIEVPEKQAQDLLMQKSAGNPADPSAVRPERTSGGTVSAKEKIDARRRSEAERLAGRKMMEQEVGRLGILGVLSGGAGTGSGDPVLDVLGGVGAEGQDLDGVIAGLSGMAVAGQGNQHAGLGRTLSGRVTGPATVEDLVSGIGTAGSAEIGRKGHIGLILESARVSGSGARYALRSSEEISAMINDHNQAIEYCYKRALKLSPGLEGSVVVEFVIGHTGRTGQARILQSSLADKSVETCILSRIRGWRFRPIERTGGTVTVRQKYIFG